LIELSANHEIFYIALALAMCASFAGIIFGYRLKMHDPTLYRAVESGLFGWWPFWVFNFLSPIKWRLLSPSLKPLAIVVMTTLGLSVAMMLFIVFRFAASSGSL